MSNDDGSGPGMCCCEADYECDHCGSQTLARIAEYEAEFDHLAAASVPPKGE